MQNILLIEDSLDMHAMVQSAIGKKFQLKMVTTVTQALQEIKTTTYSLILLDVSLPDGTGFEFCAQLKLNEKNRNSTVIFLTGKNSTTDKVMGFSLGADDYVVKPIDPLEFRARIEAKMRKIEEISHQEENYVKGSFRVSTSLQKIFANDNDLSLTSFEFKILFYFLRHEEHVLSREQILNEVWGLNTHVNDRTIDTHIYTLRQKLGVFSTFVHTVPRLGYKFSQTETVFLKVA